MVETSFATGTDPDGLLVDATGTVWFAKDNTGELGSFTPTTTGSVTITSTKIGQINPQMLALDPQGNIWYSEGRHVAIGEYNPTTHAHTDYSLASVLCPTLPCANGMYTGAIAVDSHGLVWFDEGTTGTVGFLDPVSKAITVEATVPSPSLGLITDGTNAVWVTEKAASKLAEIVPVAATPSPGASPSPSGTPPPPLPPGPVSQKWYFAEGKVGQGFTQYLTIQNPDPHSACTVSIQYLLSTSTPAPRSITVAPNTRWTEGVNADLGVAASSSGYQAVSTIVSVSNPTSCKGVVAERPMYFTNFKGVSSGTDALGATKLGSDFYFADVSTLAGYNSYITILNPPGGAAATITATYSLGGVVQGSDTLVVAPGTRGTILPRGLGERAAAWVHSTAPVVVERPTYFAGYTAGNAQRVWGAATVVGAPAPSGDWRFAEGYVGSGFQENLVLANFGSVLANATVVLEYDNGATLTNTYPIRGQDSISLDVNAATAGHVGVCAPTPCALSQSVSAEITTNAGASIVAEREMFFHYNHYDRALGRSTTAIGGTDVVGQSGAATASAYSFAEGYTYSGYDEWLTVQNPTGGQETVWVTLSNGKGTVYEMALAVGAHSRYTVNVDEPVVLAMYHSGDGTAGYQVSLTVQTTDKSVFVAERPLYWNASGTQGGDDVLGYLGG